MQRVVSALVVRFRVVLAASVVDGGADRIGIEAVGPDRLRSIPQASEIRAVEQGLPQVAPTAPASFLGHVETNTTKVRIPEVGMS
jgi:hypothetical protein